MQLFFELFLSKTQVITTIRWLPSGRKAWRRFKEYRDTIDASAPAYLVIFDRRPKARELSWDEKISWTVDEESGVTVLGC
jgi:hypothetical protein